MDLLRRYGWQVRRPQPNAWRGVYAPGGRCAPMDTATAKRVALARLYCRPCVGAPWLVYPEPAPWLPPDVPDHAAEADAMGVAL